MKVWVCTVNGHVQKVAADQDIAYMWLKSQRRSVLDDGGLKEATTIIPGIGSFCAKYEDVGNGEEVCWFAISQHKVFTTRGQMAEVM